MKNILLIFTFLLSTSLFAQSGSVYFFNFTLDPELTDYIKVENKSKQWFSGWSESQAMPDEIVDSIKSKTETAFSNKLDIPVTMCYRTNKKGENLGSAGVFGALEGMPDNTFNKGKEDGPDATQYIYFSVQIYAAGGTSITMVDKKSKLKPKLQLTVKVLDADKKKLWENKVVIKDFEKLRSTTKFYGAKEVTTSETLTPYDIYAMFLMGLEELCL